MSEQRRPPLDGSSIGRGPADGSSIGRGSADGPSIGRQPGWREVIVVAAVVVGVVLGLAIATSALPTGLQEIVFRTPLAIVVLAAGTVGLLLWLAFHRSA